MLLHRSDDRETWDRWLWAHGGKPLEHYRHLDFNLDELALDAASRGLGVAMTDWELARESIERGLLAVPFGGLLKTGGVYTMRLQPSARTHPAREAVARWFAEQSGRAWR